METVKSIDGPPTIPEDLMFFVAQMYLIQPLNGGLQMAAILASQILASELLTLKIVSQN